MITAVEFLLQSVKRKLSRVGAIRSLLVPQSLIFTTSTEVCLTPSACYHRSLKVGRTLLIFFVSVRDY